MRSQTMLETVSWSPQPRYVSRPQNIGDAVTQGVELEAKFRLGDVMGGDSAPKVDVRANASLFRSRVKSVPGPDNRLDQQPDCTANLGADHRVPGWPLTLGGNLNWTPGYETRVSELQTARQGRKLVIDAYGLWVFSPTLQLRVTASNLNPRDYLRRQCRSGDAGALPRDLGEHGADLSECAVQAGDEALRMEIMHRLKFRQLFLSLFVN
jgi:iron complex outermembrane receptor protein